MLTQAMNMMTKMTRRMLILALEVTWQEKNTKGMQAAPKSQPKMLSRRMSFEHIAQNFRHAGFDVQASYFLSDRRWKAVVLWHAGDMRSRPLLQIV